MGKDLIEWKDEMKTGVERIDEQHFTLVMIINRLQKAINMQADITAISLIFGQLASYTKFHFKAEELVIAQTNKAALSSHRLLHQEFVERLREYEKKFRAGENDVVIRLLDYLRVWLVDHILKEDLSSLRTSRPVKITHPKPQAQKMSDWEWVFSELEKKKHH